jgi:hypothetical protein
VGEGEEVGAEAFDVHGKSIGGTCGALFTSHPSR